MKPFAKLILTTVLCGTLASPSVAHAAATSAEKAAAEALFDQGVALLRAHDYAGAAAKLEASQRIEPAIGTLLYLGECYERLGRTASAWAMFREANSMARAAGETDRAKLAGERAARLEPELAYLEISVGSGARPSDLVIKRGSDPLKPELYGASIPVDPGVIQVEASATGYATYSTTITLAPRDKSSLSIPALSPLPTPAQAPADAAAAPYASLPAAWRPIPEEPATAGKARPLAYVFGGLGLAGIGIGSYFGLQALSKNNEAEDVHGCEGDTCRDEAGLALTEDAQAAATYSNIAFAAGGGALALGVIIFVMTAPQKESAVVVAPSFAKNGAGLSAVGRF